MLLRLNIAELIGYLAAACTTLSFVPQIVKIRKQGGRDLSYSMLAIYFVGLMLWLGYGILIHAPAVIAANVASGILVALAILLKATQPSELSQADERLSAAEEHLELAPAPEIIG